jgi:hypothetical protein
MAFVPDEDRTNLANRQQAMGTKLATRREYLMFTLISVGLIILVGFLANREQSKDSGGTEDYIRYTRQDTRAVAWLLAAAVIMLGVIADRIH